MECFTGPRFCITIRRSLLGEPSVIYAAIGLVNWSLDKTDRIHIMNRYSRIMNKVFSLVALICLAFMQVMPISSVSARPANTQALACGTSNNTLLMCIPDGSVSGMPPNGIEVIPAGGGTPVVEPTNDGITNANAGPSLSAHVGDTVQVPFEFADVAASKCNIPKFSPILTLNPLAANTRNISTPT